MYPGKLEAQNPAYKGAAEASPLMIRRDVTKNMWELANEIPLNTLMNNMRKEARATYMGDWGGKYCVEQWPEMKSFVVDAPVSLAAPLLFGGPDDENSSVGEEAPPLDESTSGEEPEDNSSEDSTDEDGPSGEKEEYDPYDEDQGQWPITAEEEEEKVPQKSARGRGRPRGRGGSLSKRSRGK